MASIEGWFGRAASYADDADFDHGLLACEQDFVHALARPHAGEYDIDVAAGLEAGEPDHALGEVDDFHRLAHIEHIDRDIRTFGPERVACGRDDEVARFANGHEIAHHVGMRDRYRPAGIDLRLELRHHRAV